MHKSATVSLVSDGDDQIICLPDGFEFQSDQVVVTRVGKCLFLSAEEFDAFESHDELRQNAAPDFMGEDNSIEREPQRRPSIDENKIDVKCHFGKI